MKDVSLGVTSNSSIAMWKKSVRRNNKIMETESEVRNKQ